MSLALAILFLWLAGVCFYVAFHPLSVEHFTTKGGSFTDLFGGLQTNIANVPSAYKTEG